MPSGAIDRWKPHVTVAAVLEQGGRFLLVEEETSDGLKLNNPAGHLEPGESPAQGCAREVLLPRFKAEHNVKRVEQEESFDGLPKNP